MQFLLCMSEFVWENIKIPILVSLVALVILFICVIAWSRKHKKFINKSSNISLGMTKSQVISIMGGYPTSTERNGDKEILIWEKNQWKGIAHGGTLTRGVKVVFLNGKVYDISSKNMDKSTFW